MRTGNKILLINNNETVVNPATEDKQDEIIDNVSPRSDLEGLGDKTVGTMQVEIVITGIPHTIRLRADTSNTGIIYIGKSGVLADGSNDFVRLESGDEIIMDYDDTTNALYAISDTDNQKINIGVIL